MKSAATFNRASRRELHNTFSRAAIPPCKPVEPGLMIELKHNGERLTLRRIRNANGVEELHLLGTLPPHRQGPPLHIHFAEDEHGEVVSGVLSASLDGKHLQIEAGGHARFPIGSTHRYLQALFEVLNAGAGQRPPIFYMAHVLHRHRHTQLALLIPRPVQRVLFPIIILLGSMLGKYRGTDWPGCPTRCTGAPLTSDGPQTG